MLLREAGAPALFARFGAGLDVASMLATVLAYLPKIRRCSSRRT